MSDFARFLFPLLLALLLDACIGDPHRMPHPIRLFGQMIAWLEKRYNHGSQRKLKGTLVALFLVSTTALFFVGLDFALRKTNEWVWLIGTSIFVFYGICTRSLIQEVWWVEKAIRQDDLSEARRRLSFIVGRDTTQLNYQQIRTAMIETLAENLSDGIIAPLFFYALGGLPCMMAYKMINTMDSMIGYKNERYADFGYFAARILDDGANYIPARLTAGLMFLFRPSRRVLRFIRRYARSHSSPNSGYPESTMAGILDIRMGGPNIYYGKLVSKPYIGENDRPLSQHDVLKAFAVVIFSVVISVIIFSLIHYFLYFW